MAEIKETSQYKITPGDVSPDKTLREDAGWIKMDVRWVVTNEKFESKTTVVGRTILAPGIGAKHDIHRHPNAEEWEYVLHGVGIKHIGEESFFIRVGDLVFQPRNVYHGLENGSETEPLITLWGYTGASSLKEAGYFTPEDDRKAEAGEK